MESVFARDLQHYPILLVEDNALMRLTLENDLRNMGFAVAAAENGKQAMDMMAVSHFPIIVTDLIMPEMDGLELCSAIRKGSFESYVYLIMITSLESKEDMIRGLESGADEYLVKPVDRSELTVRLKTAVRILSLESSLRRSYEEIKALSVKDSLTKVFNRGYLDEYLVHEVKRAYRFDRSLAVIMFDIDRFKQINDTFGHAAGDQVLMDCAWLMSISIRQEIDWIARYGGEEFTVVLPETPVAGARIAAERLRDKLESHFFVAGGMELQVTASFGVAGFTPSGTKEELDLAATLLAKADQCLYRAKREGRNRVVSSRL